MYIRVSTEEQAERYGIALQKESLMGLIKSRGKLANGSDALMLAGENYIYIDDGISGTTPLDERPAFSQLKEDILNAPDGSKPFDIVAVFKIDRFARRLKILLDVIDFFDDYDIKFLSANESIDTSTPFGKAILGIIGVIAELELENIKLRTQAGREEAVKAGKAMGAVAPYGFIKDAEGRLARLDPEAQCVERIFELFVREQMSTQGIATLLTKEGVLSPAASAVYHGKRKNVNKVTPKEFWRAEIIMKILKDERYVGNYYYNRFGKKGMPRLREEWKLSEHRLPMIINPLTFDKAQKLLSLQKHGRKNVHSEDLYLLSGLLQCETCRGESDKRAYWTGSRKGLGVGKDRFTHYYQCGRKNSFKFRTLVKCMTIPMPAKEIEDFILKECIRIVSNPRGVYDYQQKLASSRSEIKKLQKRQGYILGLIKSAPQQKEVIRDQHKAGIIDMIKLKQEFAELEERAKRNKEELDAIEEILSQKTVSQGYVRSLEVFAEKYKGSLEDMAKDRQKAYELIHSLVDSIIVYSRPVNSGDRIAGTKRAGQCIPDQLAVKLRLPQEFLTPELMGKAGGSGQEALNGGDGRS